MRVPCAGVGVSGCVRPAPRGADCCVRGAPPAAAPNFRLSALSPRPLRARRGTHGTCQHAGGTDRNGTDAKLAPARGAACDLRAHASARRTAHLHLERESACEHAMRRRLTVRGGRTGRLRECTSQRGPLATRVRNMRAGFSGVNLSVLFIELTCSSTCAARRWHASGR
jgi:hypothetical protein